MKLTATRIYIISLIVAALDQASKLFVSSKMQHGDSVSAGPLHVTVVHNTGGAFGLFQSGAALLAIVSLAVVVVIVAYSRRVGSFSGLVGTALGLELGGAAGNLADRLRLGYVLDFIDLRVWPVFNVADAAITIGIVLFAAHLILSGKQTCREDGDTPPEPTER
ncbi:MAG: signal peptidase II [Armatimonadetes bacterium]|nr:signal peptidase II [Armatimonadota bacterium]